MQVDDENMLLKLPAVLDLAAAEEFIATLRQHLQGEGGLRLDASAVETLTLPCVQILLAAMRDHDQISIEQPSIEFANAFQDWGLPGPTATLRPAASLVRRRSRKHPKRKMTKPISSMSRRMSATWPSEL